MGFQFLGETTHCAVIFVFLRVCLGPGFVHRTTVFSLLSNIFCSETGGERRVLSRRLTLTLAYLLLQKGSGRNKPTKPCCDN